MVLAHKNSIRLLQLQPALTTIKRRYAGDKQRLNEEQYNLFQQEKYSPLVGLVPLFAQLFLIMGMLQVMYHPLQHMLRLDRETINRLVTDAGASGFAPQLQIIGDIVGYDWLLFLGLNLGMTPSFANPTIELAIVPLAGLVALAFCLVQNAISPGALSQGQRTNTGLTLFTVGLSVYFAWALPVGVGLYWTVGNFAAIGVVLVLNFIYPPKKLAADALEYIEANRKTPGEVRKEKELKKELAVREKADAKKFSMADKQLVFYALTSGQYKFYKNIIDYILQHSDIVIHYLTNDPNDAVFQKESRKLIPYYVGQQKTISIMLKLNTDIMVTTVPDLQTLHMKRSVVRDDIEYIYTFHSLTSTHLIYRENAFDNFDTVFCVGQHQTSELRYREELAGLPKRNLVKVGYGLYDQLLESYSHLKHSESSKKPRILIAPSWQADNIFDICIDKILEALLGRGYTLVLRPHPQYVRLFPEKMEALVNRYLEHKRSGEVVFELDFSSNESIFASDLLITDWSGVSYEFSYCTLKPCVFINTPMKILNPNYPHYPMEALDIMLRDKVGVSIEVGDVGTINEAVSGLLADANLYKEQIEEMVKQYVYHPTRSGEAGGKYILRRISACQ